MPRPQMSLSLSPRDAAYGPFYFSSGGNPSDISVNIEQKVYINNISQARHLPWQRIQDLVEIISPTATLTFGSKFEGWVANFKHRNPFTPILYSVLSDTSIILRRIVLRAHRVIQGVLWR